jgi:hypothetical protein
MYGTSMFLGHFWHKVSLDIHAGIAFLLHKRIYEAHDMLYLFMNI